MLKFISGSPVHKKYLESVAHQARQKKIPSEIAALYEVKEIELGE